jgi:hypothetical protein
MVPEAGRIVKELPGFLKQTGRIEVRALQSAPFQRGNRVSRTSLKALVHLG